MDGNVRARRPVSRRTMVQSVGGAVIAGATLSSVGTGATVARAAAESPPIIGTWLITPPGQAPVLGSGLMFFHSDGVCQYAGAPVTPTQNPGDPADAAEYQTINGGQWLQTGFNEYTWRVVGIDYDARGIPFTLDSIEGTVTYDPLHDLFTTTFRLTETDLNGTPTGGTLNAVVSGRRIGVTP